MKWKDLEGRDRNTSVLGIIPEFACAYWERSVSTTDDQRVKGHTSFTQIRSISSKSKYLAWVIKPVCLVAALHFRQHKMGGACSTCDGRTHRIQDMSDKLKRSDHVYGPSVKMLKILKWVLNIHTLRMWAGLICLMIWRNMEMVFWFPQNARDLCAENWRRDIQHQNY